MFPAKFGCAILVNARRPGFEPWQADIADTFNAAPRKQRCDSLGLNLRIAIRLPLHGQTAVVDFVRPMGEDGIKEIYDCQVSAENELKALTDVSATCLARLLVGWSVVGLETENAIDK